MPQLTNAQVLLVKNSGGADLDFLAIHLYHPEAPESQNNQVVTPVRLYSKRHLYIRGCFDLAPPPPSMILLRIHHVGAGSLPGCM